MTSEQPLVSVNIATYNRSELLRKCLESVLRQSYTNLEINIVDDGSTDDTQTVVQEFMVKDSRVKYIRHQKNMGVAHAKNRAYQECTGVYVAFMDDDDVWIDPDKLAKQVYIMESNPGIGIVCSNVNILGPDGRSHVKTIEMPKSLVRHILRYNSIIYNSTVLTRRSIMEKTNGFDLNLSRGIDSDYFRYCIVKLGYDVYFMNEVTAIYREYGNDRVTLVGSKNAIKKLLHSHFYTIRKYFVQFLTHPFALMLRMAKILKYTIKYVRI